ncbi:MAG: hypothetical protein JRI68_16665 [Deltaproteobacteria bacterium]|nr:hypothetical protein [Deltaproteobacteria bacterium]
MKKHSLFATLLLALLAATCTMDFDEFEHGLSTSTSSGTGGTTSSSGTGGVGGLFNECDTPADCNGQDTDCQTVTCQGNTCGFDNAAISTACDDDAGNVCDGLGHCVECITADDCPGSMDCQALECVGTACDDTEMNGDETDVDCGGSCPPCENGDNCLVADDCVSKFCDGDSTCAACTGNTDCAGATDTWCDNGLCVDQKQDGTACGDDGECVNGHCADGLCCDTDCVGECRACAASISGGSDGVCTFIPLGQDPETECNQGEHCQGDGTCGTCGIATTPTGGTCPGVCSGGCANDVCVIDCGTTNCKNGTVACPAGFACEVQCPGLQDCQGATIDCPAAHACTVDCAGTQSCKGAAINCSSDGPCSVSCSNANQACQSAVVTCGTNACTASCAGPNDPPTVTCGSACACTAC